MPHAAFSELAPDSRAVGYDAYSRAFQFVERDPLLVGWDREFLSGVLSQRIRELVQRGERDVIRVANAAITRVRELTSNEHSVRTPA